MRNFVFVLITFAVIVLQTQAQPGSKTGKAVILPAKASPKSPVIGASTASDSPSLVPSQVPSTVAIAKKGAKTGKAKGVAPVASDVPSIAPSSQPSVANKGAKKAKGKRRV